VGPPGPPGGLGIGVCKKYSAHPLFNFLKKFFSWVEVKFSVCVPDGIEVLVVWIQNQQKTKIFCTRLARCVDSKPKIKNKFLGTSVPKKSFHYSCPSPMRSNELWTRHGDARACPWLSTAVAAGSV